MDRKKPKISVVIPAFNEEASIGFVLDGVHTVLKSMNLPYEIIVVDDGSLDRTKEVAKARNVILIENGKNRGKGHALKRGLIQTKGELVVTMDADGSHKPKDISALLYPFFNGDDCDSVFSVRFHNHTGKMSTSKLHLIGNKIISAITLFITGKYISDTQSGFRVFKREILRNLALSSSRYEIESEILIKLLKNGHRIREVPIDCAGRFMGNTRISSFTDGLRILKVMLLSVFLRSSSNE
jgi:glycosyltransferase involved in cell wall biosynthesis